MCPACLTTAALWLAGSGSAGGLAVDLFFAEEQWAKLGRPTYVEAAQDRLTKLSDWLKDRDYLEDRFTAADLMMTTVLRNLRHTDMVANMPMLEAYRLRCEARPAFAKALADQMAVFANNAPAKA